jgi:hypothetical protein
MGQKLGAIGNSFGGTCEELGNTLLPPPHKKSIMKFKHHFTMLMHDHNDHNDVTFSEDATSFHHSTMLMQHHNE